MSTIINIFFISISIILFSNSIFTSSSTAEQLTTDDLTPTPTPTPWPEQFHSVVFSNYSGQLQFIDLWYDWPNGRNFNIFRYQLSKSLFYNLEWNNGTSFLYNDSGDRQCSSFQVEVGIVRPNWLEGANYLGQRHFAGFLCNVWEKGLFVLYYEDVITGSPVYWLLKNGRESYFMTFEVGAFLEDAKWQVPSFCFEKIDNVASK